MVMKYIVELAGKYAACVKVYIIEEDFLGA
jgi:hypothetical protein